MNATFEQQLDIGGQTQTLLITSLKKGLVFFPAGAFSQGSLQWSPFGEFGVELSLLAGQERRRLVALYQATEQQSYLTSITLIPEHLAESPHVPQPEPWGVVDRTETLTSLAGMTAGVQGRPYRSMPSGRLSLLISLMLFRVSPCPTNVPAPCHWCCPSSSLFVWA
ncbi:MAG: DUF3598 family protein [Synechococcaceae cyanobacterium SM2_3_60]|nr:DUF3598 family protein [Synechococcaceae cyanobacterium SM2_3_60]